MNVNDIVKTGGADVAAIEQLTMVLRSVGAPKDAIDSHCQFAEQLAAKTRYPVALGVMIIITYATHLRQPEYRLRFTYAEKLASVILAACRHENRELPGACAVVNYLTTCSMTREVSEECCDVVSKLVPVLAHGALRLPFQAIKLRRVDPDELIDAMLDAFPGHPGRSDIERDLDRYLRGLKDAS